MFYHIESRKSQATAMDQVSTVEMWTMLWLNAGIKMGLIKYHYNDGLKLPL